MNWIVYNTYDVYPLPIYSFIFMACSEQEKAIFAFRDEIPFGLFSKALTAQDPKLSTEKRISQMLIGSVGDALKEQGYSWDEIPTESFMDDDIGEIFVRYTHVRKDNQDATIIDYLYNYTERFYFESKKSYESYTTEVFCKAFKNLRRIVTKLLEYDITPENVARINQLDEMNKNIGNTKQLCSSITSHD
jgi:hypothetical protein